MTPNLSFRFNPHVFVSGATPWYLSVNAFVPHKAKGLTTYEFLSTTNVISDTVLNGNYEASHNAFSYLATVSMGLPTGDSRFGLSANTVTYNVTNHFDYSIGIFDPEIEIGEGNSSSLAGQRVRKAYTAVGPLANFQVGTSVDLPFKANLEVDGYENLPIGNQNVYGTVTRKNKKGKKVTKQVLEGTGVAEDNGFTGELDVPVGPHLMLVGSYERSLIQGLDTVSAGFTWTLRRPKLQDR